MALKRVNALNAGLLRYSNGLLLQESVRYGLRNKKLEDTLILLEHEPVYTVGLRQSSYTLDEENALKTLGADFCRTNRGGLITFHGPGQLVVYPIIDLRNFTPSIRWYICHLEKTIIKVCEAFGLHCSTSPHTGVWINDAKLCAIGVHASRYITTHGLALNCNTDLRWFSHIVPCGIPNKEVTSLSEQLGREVTVSEVIPVFIDAFETIFNAQCKFITKERAREKCTGG